MPYQKDRALIFYKKYYIIYISNERERKKIKMIEFGGCDRYELEDALESLAYQVLQYQNPGWYEIPEDEIVALLKNEGLLVESY